MRAINVIEKKLRDKSLKIYTYYFVNNIDTVLSEIQIISTVHYLNSFVFLKPRLSTNLVRSDIRKNLYKKIRKLN